MRLVRCVSLANLREYPVFRALYPSVCLEFNIAPHTQLGKIIIPEKVFQDENHYNSGKYERAGEFVENLTTDSIIEFCHRWFGLANFNEFMDDMKEYQNKFIECFSGHGQYYRFWLDSKEQVKEVPVKSTYSTEEKKNVINPITKGRSFSPIVVLNKLPSEGVKYNGYYAGLG
jgi:hypothetical protein